MNYPKKKKKKEILNLNFKCTTRAALFSYDLTCKARAKLLSPLVSLLLLPPLPSLN